MALLRWLAVPDHCRRLFASAADTRLRVLSIGVVGTIGGHDRKTIAAHPLVDMVGLCDVDADALAQAAKDHPKAFQCADYREAFDKHGDKFDAVLRLEERPLRGPNVGSLPIAPDVRPAPAE